MRMPAWLSHSLLALAWCVHFLPVRAMAWLGRGIGRLLYYAARRRRHIARVNIGLCFPELTATQQEKLVRGHFISWGQAILEQPFLWWSRAASIQRYVKFEGIEHFRAAQGKPMILLAPHFAGLDMGGIRIAIETKVASMYSTQRNPVVDQAMRRSRMRFGPPVLVARRDGIRALVKALREALPLYYLPDQDYGPRESVFVPFFGVATATITGLSRLARIGDAKVVPLVTYQTSRGYVTKFFPAWDNFPTDDVMADTRRMNAFIEERAREMPEQYFWTHRRFKTRPHGEARPY